MKWKRLGRNRLLKLANHLHSGKLGHNKFNFSTFNSDISGKGAPYKCGTNGCALGECPIIFKQWGFDINGDPYWKDEWEGVERSTMLFFDLTCEESQHLFYPGEQDTKLFGGKILHEDATRKQVTKNMFDFIKIKEAIK